MDQDAVNVLLTCVVGIAVPVIGYLFVRIDNVRKESKNDLAAFIKGAEEVRTRLYDKQDEQVTVSNSQGIAIARIEESVNSVKSAMTDILGILRRQSTAGDD